MCQPPVWRSAARALLAAVLLACAVAAVAELWLGAGLLRAADSFVQPPARVSKGAVSATVGKELTTPLLPPPTAAAIAARQQQVQQSQQRQQQSQQERAAVPPAPSPWPPTPLTRQRKAAARKCGATAEYVADAARRYAAPGEAGVLVFDWRCVSCFRLCDSS